MKAVAAGQIAFRNQIRLRLQPMLHLMAGLGTLIFIGKVSFPGHLIRRGCEIYFIGACARI